jgi:hypothetical protein
MHIIVCNIDHIVSAHHTTEGVCVHNHALIQPHQAPSRGLTSASSKHPHLHPMKFQTHHARLRLFYSSKQTMNKSPHLHFFISVSSIRAQLCLPQPPFPRTPQRSNTSAAIPLPTLPPLEISNGPRPHRLHPSPVIIVPKYYKWR